MSLRLPKSSHLRTTAEFKKCYDGVRSGDAHLLVFATQNPDSTVLRFGVSVSRKHGNAVRRNRKKRLLREAFRLSRPELPRGLDIVMVPRQRHDTDLIQFQSSLQLLVCKLKRRLDARQEEAAT